MTDYSPAFLAQIPKTLGFEGGYVNDPADPGGETNFGISKRAYPSLDIANLTQDEAIAIYYTDFWLENQCDRAALVCPLSAGKYFDMCVNMGGTRATKVLQGELNRYKAAGLKTDGHIGPKTLAALPLADSSLLGWLRLGAAAYYTSLAHEHPVMLRFLKGWLRRAAA